MLFKGRKQNLVSQQHSIHTVQHRRAVTFHMRQDSEINNQEENTDMSGWVELGDNVLKALEKDRNMMKRKNESYKTSSQVEFPEINSCIRNYQGI